MFKKVTLFTDRLEEMKGFYEYQMGFRIVEEDSGSFTLAIGSSTLIFKESERKAVYHFAFNIPGNQFTLAKSWAASRVSLNRQEGMDEVFYANFNADAFYFQDPAGNVVEFIGRRNVDRMGDFTIDSLLNISEVSITTPFVERVGEQLEDMDIPVRGNKGIEAKALNFLGQGDAFILLVAPKRVWYFSKQKSEVHPLAIELVDGRQIEIDEEGHFLETRPSKPVEEGLENMGFSGVVLLKKEQLWTIAKGFADRANERPNSLGTRFAIASGCKIFTAVAICQLVEEGKLSFEDRLSSLLPESFPHFDVTLHHLLTHTSGIPDYFDEEQNASFEELWKTHPMYLMKSASDFIPLFHKKEMLFQPGEKFQYNNAGFIALGLVVEKITGQPFTEFVEQRIFAPAGMVNSGYFSLDQLPSETAYGYISEGDSWRTNQYAVPIKGGPDGGAFATAGDMVLFWEHLMDGSLVSKEMLARMLKPHASSRYNDYGYGVWMSRGGEQKYFVTGWDPGVSFQSAYYADKGAILAVLANHSESAYEAMKLVERSLIEQK
ncbi:CubicO group peptidase (beta-lactamase class C family)/catechol 2,3-dioxygenase-like lactoylglutathione lyase family enzyme [Planomicrobium koreense]|uniref:CubicO group peptidase (Beta-lactamase class C family)/catechol 2,3-dioxygenase-like lactoylglutathione lyase family enzyme n=1 Tax=Planococcus koreensis TaxID=112331 RepID=A0A7W8CWU9_9BACL|nr:serine hydrolase [Planococcus koreensis]MBB5181445.1 CubicO group peptidase (beta-lactamase class C family)/catechol 2,3-dioxygenase-like lactoylglutathione lyase family enzyme [Planococcus koreensis]